MQKVEGPVVKKAKATGLLGDIHCALKFLQDYYPRYRKDDADRVLLFWALKYNLTPHYFINNKRVLQPEVAKGTVLKTSVHVKADAGVQKPRFGVFQAGKLEGQRYATIKLIKSISWG